MSRCSNDEWAAGYTTRLNAVAESNERKSKVLVPIGAPVEERQVSAELEASGEVGQGLEAYDVKVVGEPTEHASRAHEWWEVEYKVRTSGQR